MFWKNLWNSKAWKKERWITVGIFLGLVFLCSLIYFSKNKTEISIVSSSWELNKMGYFLGMALLVFAFFYLIHGFYKRMVLEENLVKAKQDVEKSGLIKEQFLANMSHEIRTPLQAILGYTNFLAKEKMTNQQIQFVQNIQVASENLLAIVNDILDVSKIESGMMRLEKVSFSISGLMHSVEGMFLPKVLEKNIYLKLHHNPTIPDVLVGDPTRLTQILVNLISNAIKFTKQGGIDIYQEVVKKTDENLVLKISVEDTGIGIPKEKIATIFDRFEQADAQVTRVFGGSGLGLFIVKQLVDIQGGKIDVKSEFNKGSVFSIEIPFEIADDNAPRNIPESGMIELNQNFNEIKILLVEDNMMNQRVVGMFLSEWGLDYDIASNGKIAIQQVEKNDYDLILMDVQMPEMDGYSATEYLRQEMKIQTPIIAMTAHAFAGEREKALSFGMDEYISKPIKEVDLFRLLSQFVPLVREEGIKETHNEPKPLQPILSPDEIQIDYNFLMESSKGKKEYLKSILELFLRQAPNEMTALERELGKQNFEMVGKIAHSLKSTVGYVGLDDSLRPLLETIELQAKENATYEELQTLFLKLKKLMKKAVKKIKTEAMALVD